LPLEEGLARHERSFWKLRLCSGFAIGKTTVELGLWSNNSERAKFVERLNEEKSLHNPAYQIRSESGEYRTTLAFYELTDYESEPAVLAIFYDVTEQKNAQLALQTSEQKYRNFIEQSMEGIWFLAFDQPIPTDLLQKNSGIDL
jgi:PAS domain-containing protein